MTNQHPLDDPKAMQLAEQTDVSPKQAIELLKKHNGDFTKALEEARRFKAES